MCGICSTIGWSLQVMYLFSKESKMIKKLLLLLAIGLGLISCGTDCLNKPPNRAYIHESSGYDMTYHFSIYIPSSGISHNPTDCTEYEYAKIDIYTDDMGTITGDKVIWNNLYGEVAFQDYGVDPANITLNFLNKAVTISGWDRYHNGTYKVETSSPDSWGTPIS